MKDRAILITGGAGFIGSHVVRMFVHKYPGYHIVNFDKLTYAGNLGNLSGLEDRGNYTFIKGDICDFESVSDLFRRYSFGGVIHLAAESHVDRSIEDPFVFARTNVMGTLALLEAAKLNWDGDHRDRVFLHISTDEVYGSLGCSDPAFTEKSRYEPHSPYSASKASSDHFARAFHDTHSLPVIVTNCSNNYGPCQFPEKLIPLVINNIKLGKSIPVYGAGENVRDWLHVEDHARALDLVFHGGKAGTTYNIGGGNEVRNIDLVRTLISITDRKLGRPEGFSDELVMFVRDRAGHDMRYAVDSSRIRRELGWEPLRGLEEGLDATVDWYLANDRWLESVTSGEYALYYEKMYKNR